MGNNRTYSTPAVYSSTDKLDTVLKSGAVSSADLGAELQEKLNGLDINNTKDLEEVRRILGQVGVYADRLDTLEKERAYMASYRVRMGTSPWLPLKVDTQDNSILTTETHSGTLKAYTKQSGVYAGEVLTITSCVAVGSIFAVGTIYKISFATPTIPIDSSTFFWDDDYYLDLTTYGSQYKHSSLDVFSKSHAGGTVIHTAGKLWVQPNTEAVFELAPKLKPSTYFSSSLVYGAAFGSPQLSRISVPDYPLDDESTLADHNYFPETSLYVKTGESAARIDYTFEAISERAETMINDFRDFDKIEEPCIHDDFEANHISILEEVI